MSSKKLIVLVPAIVVLLAAGSCGFSAHAQDVEFGEFGPLHLGLAILGSLVVAIVLGVAALIAVLVSRQEGADTAAALLLAAVMAPIGVLAGARLGESGIIPPAPSAAPESIPSPPPTIAAHDGQATGTMTLDLDAPNELHVAGAASCESGHSLIREWDQNADWDVEWSGRVVIISPQLFIAARPPGPTWVDRMTITFAEKTGDLVAYSFNGSLPEDATRAEDGGQSGVVEFELRQVIPPSGTAAPGTQWPASVKGRISWQCDF